MFGYLILISNPQELRAPLLSSSATVQHYRGEKPDCSIQLYNAQCARYQTRPYLKTFLVQFLSKADITSKYIWLPMDGIRERTSSDDMSDPLVLSHTCKTFLSKPTCVTCHCHLSHSQAKIYPCLLNQQFWWCKRVYYLQSMMIGTPSAEPYPETILCPNWMAEGKINDCLWIV